MKLRSFEEGLLRELQTPEFAAAYLEDALTESVEEFLVALRKYVQANGGMTHGAEQSTLTREALYRMLSTEGNPELRSIHALLRAHGLKFSIQPTGETLAA